MAQVRKLLANTAILGTSLGMLMLGALSCVPMTNTGALNCEYDGETVNVREVYGSWKLISGYTDGRVVGDLDDNYEVLTVQTGGGLCRSSFESRESIETLLLATYSHKPSLDQLVLSISYPAGASDEEITATYKFTGTCTDPKMLLTYSTGSSETYQFYSKDVGDGCPF